MEQPVATIEPEINIREFIETLLKGKFIIAIITVIAIVLSGVISFFMLPNIYEAKSVLLTNPINFKASDIDSNESNLIDYLTKLPNITIETYLQQILSPFVLDSTIKTADLRDSQNNYISASSLAASISATNIAGSLIEIRVSNQDPVKAALIANTIGQSFIEFVTANTKKLGQQSVNLIAEQLAIEEQALNEKSNKLAEYWKNNPNIDVLKGEVNNLASQTVSYKGDLRDIELQIATDAESLKALLSAVGSTSGINIDDFKIIIDLYADGKDENSDQVQLNLNSDALSEALIKVDINKIQTRLVSNNYRKEALVKMIDEMENKLIEYQILLTEQEYKYNAINRDLEMAKQAYDAYQQKYKEAMLTAAADIGKTSVIVSSAAVIPANPVSPNRMMNLIIALFLGLIIGSLVVLFRDYWRKSKVMI